MDETPALLCSTKCTSIKKKKKGGKGKQSSANASQSLLESKLETECPVSKAGGVPMNQPLFFFLNPYILRHNDSHSSECENPTAKEVRQRSQTI